MKNFLKISFIYLTIIGFLIVPILISIIEILNIISYCLNIKTFLIDKLCIALPPSIIIFILLMSRRNSLDINDIKLGGKNIFVSKEKKFLKKLSFYKNYWGLNNVGFLIKDNNKNFTLKYSREIDLYKKISDILQINQVSFKKKEYIFNDLFEVNNIEIKNNICYLFLIDIENNILIDPKNSVLCTITSQHQLFKLITQSNKLSKSIFLCLKSLVFPKNIKLTDIGWNNNNYTIEKTFQDKKLLEFVKTYIELYCYYFKTSKNTSKDPFEIIENLIKKETEKTAKTTVSADKITSLNCLYYYKNYFELNNINKTLNKNKTINKRKIL